MKIALCKTSFAGPVSGADETFVTYAIALQEEGCDVRAVLLFRCGEDDPYYIRLKNARVPVEFVVRHSLVYEALWRVRDLMATLFFFVFMIPGAKEFLRTLWQKFIAFTTRPRYGSCRRFFRERGYDVLHVFTPDAGANVMIRAGHSLHIPVLYHELGTPHHARALRVYYERLGRVLPLCKEVAALSPCLASQWSARYPFLNTVRVLPTISQQSKTFNFYTRIPNTPQTVFGFAARLEQEKGPGLLVDATAIVNKQTPLAVARFAGTGTEQARVKARARELALGNSCEFVGHYSDPLGRSAFMNSLDVFVLPSFAEGTPNSIMEAMSHGLPIIASDVGGIADMLGDQAGILVPPGDVNALANAMSQLAGDASLRAQMGKSAKDRYQRLFSPAAVVPLLVDTYARLTANGNGDAVSKNGHHPWASHSIRNVSSSRAAESP